MYNYFKIYIRIYNAKLNMLNFTYIRIYAPIVPLS